MDRNQKPAPRRKREFANQGEIQRTDPAEFDSPTGREDHMGLAETHRIAGSEIKKPVGAKPRSEVTRRHDAGSGANETSEGLNSLDESLRRAAEDSRSGGADADEDMPGFDRANAPPEI
jgi:hypothetical protein